MWTQKATARRVMIQPATETGRKTGPKGLNQGMGCSALASISEQPMGYFRNLKGYAGRDDPKVDGRYTLKCAKARSPGKAVKWRHLPLNQRHSTLLRRRWQQNPSLSLQQSALRRSVRFKRWRNGRPELKAALLANVGAKQHNPLAQFIRVRIEFLGCLDKGILVQVFGYQL